MIWILLKSLLISSLGTLLVRALLPSIKVWRQVIRWNVRVRNAERDPDYWTAINWLNWLFRGIGAGLRGIAKKIWQFRDAYQKTYPGKRPSRLAPILLAMAIGGVTVTPFDAMHLQWFADTFYYVDYIAGDDTKDGLSQANAWKHMPGDGAATNVPAAASIATGYTIWLKGGVTYTLTNAVAPLISSARYANGINIRSGNLASPPWGSGRAVIDGADGVATYGLVIWARDSVLIEGIEIKNIALNGTYNAVAIDGGSTNCTFRSLVVHDIGSSTLSLIGIDIHANSAINNSNNVVEECIVYNCTSKCINTDGCGGNIIRGNVCFNYGSHGVNLQSSYNRVYRNTVHTGPVVVKSKAPAGYGAPFKLVSSTGSITCTNNLVYNNITYDVGEVFTLEVAASGSNSVSNNGIYNNTAYDCCKYVDASGYGAVFLHTGASSTGTVHDNVIKNNIFSGIVAEPLGSRYAIRTRTEPVQNGPLGDNNIISNNLWFSAAGALLAITYVGGTQQPTLDNFADGGSVSPDYRFKRAAVGAGNSFTDSPTQKFNEDPLFYNAEGYMFWTQVSSPVRGSGVNLSGVFTDDFVGTVRPASAAWDMGAYEFQEYSVLTTTLGSVLRQFWKNIGR